MKVAIIFLVLVGLLLVQGDDTTPPPACKNCTDTECCLKPKGTHKVSCAAKGIKDDKCRINQRPKKNGVYKHECPCVKGLKCQTGEKEEKKKHGKCQAPSA